MDTSSSLIFFLGSINYFCFLIVKMCTHVHGVDGTVDLIFMVQLLVIVVVQGVVVGTVGIIFLVQFLIASNKPGRVNKKK